jgi:hypothetical protein
MIQFKKRIRHERVGIACAAIQMKKPAMRGLRNSRL